VGNSELGEAADFRGWPTNGGFNLYMTLYVCNKISDYWDIKDFTLTHPIPKEITRDKFQELHIVAGRQGDC
jgi:hypothetical protein